MIMCAILMSIKPEFVKQIFVGTKRFEFRKRACKQEVDKIYIYSTTPVMKVVGEVQVEDVLIGKPEDIWKYTKQYAGIKKDFFDKYYLDKEQAVAYKLGCVMEYDRPKELVDFGVKTAPQSYQYIDLKAM